MLGIFRWWKNNHSMFIRCNVDESSIIISKKLYESIRKDNPDASSIRVMFTKVTDKVLAFSSSRCYAMIFNPRWELHGVADSHMYQTIPVTLGKYGHIGFQSVQPSVQEIAVFHGMREGKFDVGISRRVINGEPIYILCKK